MTIVMTIAIIVVIRAFVWIMTTMEMTRGARWENSVLFTLRDDFF